MPRPREWDAVVTVDAALEGDAAAFAVLPDGTVAVESGPAEPGPLADAAGRAVDAPFRAEAVRRDGRTWAVAVRRIRVLELPGAEGDEIRVTVTSSGRDVRVDGELVFVRFPELERRLRGNGVATARRIAGAFWEFRVDTL